jgi:hypothetical protein
MINCREVAEAMARGRKRKFGDDKFEAMMWRLKQQPGYEDLLAQRYVMDQKFMEEAMLAGEKLWALRDEARERVVWWRYARSLERAQKRFSWLLFPPLAFWILTALLLVDRFAALLGAIALVLGLFSGALVRWLENAADRSIEPQIRELRLRWEQLDRDGRRNSARWWENACVSFPGYPPDWPARRKEVLVRDGNRCRVCGRVGSLHIHHVTPLSLGGDNRLGNLVALCDVCHSASH